MGAFSDEVTVAVAVMAQHPLPGGLVDRVKAAASALLATFSPSEGGGADWGAFVAPSSRGTNWGHL